MQYVGRERLGKREKAGFADWWRTQVGKIRRRYEVADAKGRNLEL